MKEIKLTKGKVALIDDEDYDFISSMKWRAAKVDNTYYAIRFIKIKGLKTTTSMHRTIMNAEKGTFIDHADRNGLNNQRYNLRFCTHQQNTFNRKHKNPHSSKHTGVSAVNGRYRACIKFKRKSYYLGTFNNEDDAGKAYDKKAIELFGEFANLNFKDNG